jgi:hypothetical protein
MRFLGRVSLLLLATGMALAQTSAPATEQGSDSSVADQLKALKTAMAAQQAQMVEQQQKIDELEKVLAQQNSGTAHVQNAALTTNSSPTATAMQDTEKPKESPLSFRIGGTEFTPGGFVDFENVFRSTNTGNSTATSFWAIPYSNTVNGHLTEYRSTGQYSRFNLKITGKYGANNVTGYLEGDFNGNDAANVFVTSNPHTTRIRLYWVDLKRGKWEFLGGQTWGLQTGNRVGVSPNPSDVFVTIGEDAQTHVGINYTRAGEFRAAYHFNDNFVWAVALQNPDQFTGQGAEVVFPTQFNAQLGGQFDAANQATVPSLFPDIITKAAYDKDVSGRHFHLEGGALMTTVKITDIPTVTNATFVKHSKVGGGIMGGTSLDLLKKLRFVGYGMWGNGVGRYLIGMGPQAVVFPTPSTCTAGGNGGCDLGISMVHSGDVTLGFESQVHPKTVFGFYYGGAYFQRNFFPDFTVAPNAAGLHPNIGFGFPNVVGPTPALSFGGSNNANNRAIQEGTFDWTQTFWRNPQYGAVLLVTQASYVTRSPWFVANGAPKNAHLGMGYVSLRYVLP